MIRTARWIQALAVAAVTCHAIAAQQPSSVNVPTAEPARILLPLAGSDTEQLGYPLQTVDRLAVRKLLVGKSFAALDTLLDAYTDSAARDYRFEYRLFDAYDAFAVCALPEGALLDEWVQQTPSSGAALLARSMFFIACGWRARGGAYSKDTPDRQFAVMWQFFRAAVNDLGAAESLAPTSLVLYNDLMLVARAKGDVALSRKLLDQGLKVQPYSFVLRSEHMSVLLPRWGGSYQAMDDFAAEAAPYAAKNPRLETLRGYADWDRARMLLEQHQNVEAEQELQEALRYGNLYRFLFERARFYRFTGRYADALADLNQVLLQRPQAHDALSERARVEYALGKDARDTARANLFSRALADIDLAVKLDPTDFQYQDQLARYRLSIDADRSSRIVVRMGWSSSPVSSAALDPHIRNAIKQLGSKGPVSRAAFYDITYPRDSMELGETGGYGILLVTAIVHDSTDIPLTRVYAHTAAGDQNLVPFAAVASRIAPSNSGLVRTVGPFRFDAVYLFPVAARLELGELVAAFADSNTQSALVHLDRTKVVPAWVGRAGWPSVGPSPSAIWELIEREYPDLAVYLAE